VTTSSTALAHVALLLATSAAFLGFIPVSLGLAPVHAQAQVYIQQVTPKPGAQARSYVPAPDLAVPAATSPSASSPALPAAPTGGGNVVSVVQDGLNNQAAMDFQNGNAMTQLQQGSNNQSSLFASGSGNAVSSVQSGNGNVSSTSVFGSGNTVSNTQIGAGATNTVQHFGNGGSVSVLQVR
jgi:hypothetical protein